MTHPTSTSDSPPVGAVRSGAGRTWHVAATILVVIVAGGLQVTAENLWLDSSPVEDVPAALGGLWLVYLISGVIATALFTAIRVARGGQMATLRYSERYLVGLGYGLVTSLIIAALTGILLASSAGQAVEYTGMAMSMSLITLQLPIAGIVGGLVWHLLTRVAGAGPTPVRGRRPWEDED